jgi:large subunit ribosomal protein L6
MSRIGKQPVTIPEKVEVKIDGNVVSVKGPKGELTQNFETEFVSVSQVDGTLVVERANDSKSARARHGLYRSLFQNLIEGVTMGFSKKLEVRGVGYRVAQKGTDLEFNLGYSHPITFPLPTGVEVAFEEKNNNIFTLSSINKQLVGQTAANIRSLRKPEPYKGKGVRYADEHVQLKAGKSAAK